MSARYSIRTRVRRWTWYPTWLPFGVVTCVYDWPHPWEPDWDLLNELADQGAEVEVLEPS